MLEPQRDARLWAVNGSRMRTGLTRRSDVNQINPSPPCGGTGSLPGPRLRDMRRAGMGRVSGVSVTVLSARRPSAHTPTCCTQGSTASQSMDHTGHSAHSGERFSKLRCCLRWSVYIHKMVNVKQLATASSKQGRATKPRWKRARRRPV